MVGEAASIGYKIMFKENMKGRDYTIPSAGKFGTRHLPDRKTGRTTESSNDRGSIQG